MKAIISKKTLLHLICVAVMTFVGCTTDDVEETIDYKSTSQHSMKMNFKYNVSAFDASQGTRAGDNSSTWQWQDGATVYIQYYVGSTVVRGHAVYTKATNSWETFYNGTLGSSDKCEVYFFDGVSTADKEKVVLTGDEAVYGDRMASYTVKDGVMILEAYLTPLTSRIRFSGNKGVCIDVEGITRLTGYNANTNTFTKTDEIISSEVEDTGYTPYIYGVFTDENKHELSIVNSVDGDSVKYVKSFSSSVLKVGESGCMTIPTSDTNKGWTKTTTNLDIFINNNGKSAEIKMKFVSAGPMVITEEKEQDWYEMRDSNGAIKSLYNYYHNYIVDLSAFYIGETEVTQALWTAVMGDDSKWNENLGKGDDFPAYNLTYVDIITFITKLNQITNRTFRLPTEAEWRYAAIGGRNGTWDYIYSRIWGDSGDKTYIGYIGWYSNNSENKVHPVKQLNANPLGLYDVIGNVSEYCLDYMDLWFNVFNYYKKETNSYVTDDILTFSYTHYNNSYYYNLKNPIVSDPTNSSSEKKHFSLGGNWKETHTGNITLRTDITTYQKKDNILENHLFVNIDPEPEISGFRLVLQ